MTLVPKLRSWATRLQPLGAGSAALLVALVSAPSACSSDSGNRPPAIANGGSANGGGANGGSTATVGGGGFGASNTSAGDTSANAGESAGGEPAATESDAGPGRPNPGPATCSETATWTGATKVPAVSTTADEMLLSVTPDELDLAFLRSSALYVAHRATATDTFTVGAAVVVPSGWTAAQGVALSADGRRLILVSVDQTALGELTRLNREAAFSGSVDESAFVTLNQTSTYSGNIYASPVVSPDDSELFLSSVAPGGGSTVVVSTRTAATPWTPPDRVISALDGTTSERRLPTGIAADGRTLFYFNEATMKEEARWRDEPKLTSPLYDMVDLGTRRGAQPNAGCNRLYSTASSDVLVEHD